MTEALSATKQDSSLKDSANVTGSTMTRHSHFMLKAGVFTNSMFTAYLNADVDAELYLTQPEVFEAERQGEQQEYYKLRKAIYGLKQAGLAWYKHLSSILYEVGYTNSPTNRDVLCQVKQILRYLRGTSTLRSILP